MHVADHISTFLSTFLSTVALTQGVRDKMAYWASARGFSQKLEYVYVYVTELLPCSMSFEVSWFACNSIILTPIEINMTKFQQWGTESVPLLNLAVKGAQYSGGVGGEALLYYIILFIHYIFYIIF